jgi:hypothetical protein
VPAAVDGATGDSAGISDVREDFAFARNGRSTSRYDNVATTSASSTNAMTINGNQIAFSNGPRPIAYGSRRWRIG